MKGLGHCAITVAVVVASVWTSNSGAQQSSPNAGLGGTLEAKLIGDRILTRVNVQTEVWLRDTHVVIDYASPHALQMNQGVLQSLRYGPNEQALTIQSDSFRLQIPREEVAPELGPLTTELTARYDNELEQIDVIAIVGWPALKDFSLGLDLSTGSFTLRPSNEVSVSDVLATADAVVPNVVTVGQSVFIPVSSDDGSIGYMKFSTGSYHTLIDRTSFDWNSGGSQPSVSFGDDQTMRLSDAAALFPQDIRELQTERYEQALETESAVRGQLREGVTIPPWFVANKPDEPPGRLLLVSGLSLVSAFRWELNPNEGFVAITRLVDSNYSEADARFYQAATDRDVSLLRAYLQDYGDDRNVEEAVQLLFDLELEQDPSAETMLEVVDYGLNVTEDRRKFLYVFDFMVALDNDSARKDQFSDLIIALGVRALEFVSRTQQPRLRQHTQLILGDRYLAKGDAMAAWKVFLSAAFNGDPELDGYVRHELGRAYEALGRNRRAYSNYSRALSKFVGLPPPMQESAKEALARLRPLLDPDDELLQN